MGHRKGSSARHWPWLAIVACIVAVGLAARGRERMAPPQALAVSPAALLAPAPTPFNYYVATTGDDSDPGTPSAPYRSIGRAVAMAGPDATIHVAPGVYRENIVTKASGAPARRIYYVSTRRWGARIIGGGTEAAWTNHGDYVNIIGFDISGSGRIGILNWASFAIIAGNHVHDLAVMGGCTGNGGAGIENAGYASSDDDIVGNVVHDIGVPGACNGVQGIYSSNLRARIVHNVVYRASAWGIHLWHAANNVLIAHNTVFANGSRTMGGGIVIGTGDSPGGVVLDHTHVIDNIVTGNPGASIEEYCYAGQECIGEHNIVANNLVRDNGRDISLREGKSANTARR